MQVEHVEEAETKTDVVKCEYNSSCVETRGADGCWNKAQDKTWNVRDDRDDVNDVVNVR